MTAAALPLPEPPSDEVIAVAVQLDAARTHLHDAQHVAALLALDVAAGDPVEVARIVLERDLAARRVAAWDAVVCGLRAEGRRLGLFSS